MRAATRLAEGLAAAGYLSPQWREPFVRVPRELFVPDTVWEVTDNGLRSVSKATEPDRWWDLVHADLSIVTQVDDGAVSVRPRRASSSCSMPRLVALMLNQLDVAEGMRVLEIGTGTGWNAALLAAGLGDGQVISVEVDATVARSARIALDRAGRTPRVITADGAAGWASGGPYDRIIATCAVGTIPLAWITQTRPGGLILLPWGTAFHNGVLLRLEVDADGTAAGRVVGDDCVFMWLRGQRPADRDVMDYVDAAADGPTTATRTRLDPRAVTSIGDRDAAFAIGLKVPGCRHVTGWGSGAQAEECTVWFADPATGSWASATYEPGHQEYEVEQHGERSLWSDVEDAWQWWRQAGRPASTRFGVTVHPTGTTVWLDTPQRPVAHHAVAPTDV